MLSRSSSTISDCVGSTTALQATQQAAGPVQLLLENPRVPSENLEYIETEEAQLQLVADAISLVASRGVRVPAGSSWEPDEPTDDCVLAEDCAISPDGLQFTAHTGCLIVRGAAQLVLADGRTVHVSDELEVRLAEPQLELELVLPAGPELLAGFVRLDLTPETSLVIECGPGRSQIELSTAALSVHQDDDADVSSSDDSWEPEPEDPFAFKPDLHAQKIAEDERLVEVWKEKEKGFRAEIEDERRKMEERRRFKSKHAQVGTYFSPDAAVQLLVNLLLGGELRCSLNSPVADLRYSSSHIQVAPIRDNIYEWSVKFAPEGFDEGSQIRQDLIEVNKRFKYSYIEMIFRFTPDLYPFLPPTVQVVRPRFTGFMMGRIVGAKLLQLERWNPTKGVKFVLEQMQKLLQEHGRLDYRNSMNNQIYFPKGAYSEFAYLLLELSQMTDAQPRANLKYEVEGDFDGSDGRPAGSMVGATKNKTEAKNYQAKGVGYGHDSNATQFDAKEYIAAQRQRDAEMEIVLEKVLTELQLFDYSYQVAKKEEEEEGQVFDILACENDPNAGKCSVDELAQLLEESCLIPFLEKTLRSESIMDMMERESLFQVILSLLKEIASHPEIAFLVGPLPHQKRPLVDLIQPMTKAAQLYIKATSGKGKGGPELALAELITETTVVMNSTTNAQPGGSPAEDPDQRSSVRVAGVAEEWQEAAVEYQDTLGDYRLGEGDDDVFQGHHYPRPSEGMSQQKMHRVASEVVTLGSSLPVEFQGMSIFVLAHEERMDWLKVLIIGPEGTPYEDGCFEFHAVLPPNYPSTHPSCNLETTGKGSFRFGPNLYACGKVCLSLLGTWRGTAGEGWNAETSSLSQLFVSIAAIVMTADPYYNEPGAETLAGTAEGNALNEGYANIVRWGTVKHAMIGQITNPTPGFEEVIREHFRIKKDKILRNTSQWLSSSKNNPPKAQYSGYCSSHNSSVASSFASGKYSTFLEEEVTKLHRLLS